MSVSIFLFLMIAFSVNAKGSDRMLHPDYPVEDGKYQMTQEWSITLDQKHNQRVEDGSLVLWRPGFTVWINVWGNDNKESIDERLKWIIEDSSSEAFEVTTDEKGTEKTYAYRLNETEDEKIAYSYNGYVLSNDGHTQLSVYFDKEEDFELAKSIVGSVEYAQP